jgi:hypothetical protein
MMTRFFTTLANSILLLIAFSSCGKAQRAIDNGSYIVDNSIKQQVAKKVKSFNGVTTSQYLAKDIN